MLPMATIVFVIICNLLITAIAFYLVRTIWQLRRTLAGITQTLSELEGSVYNILHPAPKAIITGKTSIHNLKAVYQSKQVQMQQIRQILTLTALIYRIGGQKKNSSWGKLGKKNKKKQRSLNTIKEKARGKAS
jgi:hypothetical protein